MYFINRSELTPDKLLSLARIAETSERYEDMCEFTSELVKKRGQASQGLTVEERNLLSVAYKNVVGSKRASWRTLSAEDQIDEQILKSYKGIVEDELKAKCNEISNLIIQVVLPSIEKTKDENEVFYLKMVGDYYRYLAEFSNENEENGKNAKKYYQQATDVAEESLSETHPTRLGLALNFSVCYYEILKDPEKACQLAKKAFDGAISKLDTLNDASYKDSTLIMQLLRDNLTLWTSGMFNCLVSCVLCVVCWVFFNTCHNLYMVVVVVVILVIIYLFLQNKIMVTKIRV